METKVLNYRIIIKPDVYTGSNKPCFTAYCPTLGVADGGDTVEEAINNVQRAIEAYVESLIEDGLPVPADKPEKHIEATTQISVPANANVQFA